MENERIQIIRCFHSAFLRLFTSRRYWIEMILGFFLAFLSPYMLESISKLMKLMPPDIINAFKMGNVYNVGILAVESLDIINEFYCDNILIGILPGTFAQFMVGMVITLFISSEYKNGYIDVMIMHGQNRIQLFIKYVLLSVISIIPIELFYFFGVVIALNMNDKFIIGNADSILMIVIIQSLLIIGISVCISVISLVIRSYKSVFVTIGGLIIFPLIPSYMQIILKMDVNLDKVLLPNLLINSINIDIWDVPIIVLVILITSGIFFVFGLMYFNCKQIYK